MMKPMPLGKNVVPSHARFGVVPAIEGYEVIDELSGRPVDWKPTARSAHGRAGFLNSAAKAGTKSLCSALGAREDSYQ